MPSVFATLGGQSADPIQSANVLREITALRRDIAALVVDLGDGLARRAAASTAAVALVGEVSAAGALASFSETKLQSFRKAIGDALADGLGKESHMVQLRLQQGAEADQADPNSALFFRYAADLLVKDRGAKDFINSANGVVTLHAVSMRPFTARTVRPRATGCARFWRC